MQNDQQSPPPKSSGVIDYPARDMTITVESDMPIGRLREILAQENQQLPIDSASDDISIRELVDYDVNGPRQFGYGTLRDYLIGMEASDGHGRFFHAGGRVVKNVAGYDLCRLLIGAKGQFGKLRHLTFKLKPLPAQQSLSIAGFRSIKDLNSALERLNLTSTTPQILDVLNQQAARIILKNLLPHAPAETLSASAAVLIIGFDGSAKACEWQTRTIAEELHGTASTIVHCTADEATQSYCQAAMQFSEAFRTSSSGISIRVTSLPSRVEADLRIADEFKLSVCGRAGNGIIDLRSDTVPVDSEKLQSQFKSLVDDCSGALEIRIDGKLWEYPVTAAAVKKYSEALKKVLGSSS